MAFSCSLSPRGISGGVSNALQGEERDMEILQVASTLGTNIQGDLEEVVLLYQFRHHRTEVKGCLPRVSVWFCACAVDCHRGLFLNV